MKQYAWLIPPVTVVFLIILIVAPIFFTGAADYPGDLGDCSRYLLQYLRTDDSAWNPYVTAGRPGIIDGTLYPLHYPGYLLAYYFPGPTTLKLLYLVHLIWGALGMIWWLRQKRCTVIAAAAGGLLFAGSGFFTARIFAGQLPHVCSATWLPWVFAGWHRLLRRRAPREAIIFGLLLGGQFLAGFPQFVFITVIGLLFFMPATLLRRTNLNIKFYQRLAILLSLAGVVAFLATYHYLVPLVIFLQHSNRAAGLAPGQALTGSMVPTDLIHFWLPLLNRNPFNPAAVGSLSNFWETAAFFGIIPWVIIAVGLANGLLRRQTPRLLLLLATVSIVLALGHYTQFYTLAMKIIPGFSRMRVPGRFLLLTTFALAALTAFAIDRLRRRWIPLRRSAVIILLPVLGLELALFSWQFLSKEFPASINPPYWKTVNAAVAFLQQQPPPFRIITLAEENGPGIAMLNEGIEHRLENCGGYLGLIPKRYFELVDRFDPKRPHGTALRFVTPFGSNSTMTFLRLYNVGYLITLRDNLQELFPAGTTELGDPVFRDGPVMVYATPVQHRAAWLVHRFTVDSAPEKILARISARDFQPYQEAAACPGGAVPASFDSLPDTTAESVTLISRIPGQLLFDIANTAAAVLVVSEHYYPGWQATIDGKPVPLFPVDHALIGLMVAPGRHQVAVTYGSQPSTTQSILYTLVSVALGAYLYVFAYRLKK